MLGFLPQEVPALSPAARRSRHSSLSALVVSSFLSAILVFAVVAVAQPGEVLGATLSKVALCNANLRTSPNDERPGQEGHHDRDQGDREPEAGRRQLADDVRGGGRLGPQLVPDHRGQWQERQIALWRHLSVRGSRPVQDLRPAARHQVRRLPGEPALERLDGRHRADRHQHRHEGAGRDAGHRVVVFDDLRRQGRLRQELVSDQRGQRQERQVALRRDLPLLGDRSVQVHGHDDPGADPDRRPRRRPPDSDTDPDAAVAATPKGSTSATGRERSTGPRSRRPASGSRS